MLIINADDFGLDASVNEAVIRAFAGGLCSSATVMANMPGFDEACDLAVGKRLRDHTGIHLVLTSGVPLTDAIRRVPEFCDAEGCFKRRSRRLLHLPADVRRALAEEIRAQIARCRERGLSLTHADSHHHIHEEWAVANVLIPILKESGIPYLRVMRNTARRVSPVRKVYAWMLSGYLRRKGIRRTERFGSVYNYLDLLAQGAIGPESFEVMIHPILEGGALVEKETRKVLKDVVAQIPGYESAISFSDARWQS